MITRSRKLSLKLVYQLTHQTMICRSKCRPLNRFSIGTNRCISSSSPVTLSLHQSLPIYHLLMENELNPEAYGCAAAKDQAGIIFKAAARLIIANSELRWRFKLLES